MVDYTKIKQYTNYLVKATDEQDAWAVEYWANAIASHIARQESTRLTTEARALLERLDAIDRWRGEANK